MKKHPLKSLVNYSQFITKVINRKTVIRSTVTVWSTSPYTGVAEGEVLFQKQFKLRIREEIDFYDGLITSYGYEVYWGEEKLFWYDSFPHPDDPQLASTFPHHKHIPPDIKRNRIPAPNMSFERPNLPILMAEVEALLKE